MNFTDLWHEAEQLSDIGRVIYCAGTAGIAWLIVRVVGYCANQLLDRHDPYDD